MKPETEMTEITYKQIEPFLNSFQKQVIELELHSAAQYEAARINPIDFREAEMFSPQAGALGLYFNSDEITEKIAPLKEQKRLTLLCTIKENVKLPLILIAGRGEYPQRFQIDEVNSEITLLPEASLDDYFTCAFLLSRFPGLKCNALENPAASQEFSQMPYSRRRCHIESILLGRTPSRGFRFLDESKILTGLLPELAAGKGVTQNRFHIYDVYEHSIFACDSVTEGDFILRFSALLHDIGKVPTRKERDNGEATFYNHEIVSSKLAVPIMKRFGIPKETGLKIRFYVRNHMFHYTNEWSDRAIRRFLKKVSPAELENLIKLRQADRKGSGKKNPFPKGLEKLIQHIDEVIEREKELKVTDLHIGGKELMELGVVAGPLMGQVLKTLLEEVKSEQLENSPEQLKERAGLLAGQLESSNKAKR